MNVGHGGSVRDTSGDEEDAKDETMIPVDYAQSGMIKDDEIFARVSMGARMDRTDRTDRTDLKAVAWRLRSSWSLAACVETFVSDFISPRVLRLGGCRAPAPLASLSAVGWKPLGSRSSVESRLRRSDSLRLMVMR